MSCTGLDETGWTKKLFIENKTDADIEVAYKMVKHAIADTVVRFQIPINSRCNVFNVSSGLEYNQFQNPENYDFVFYN
ncbi:hypothetical protein FACS1894180_2610 [Bacteroidia bacterium]|nr:hypothetical protein FACS1894180_2610 [Bacteroidia bacterium]